MFDVTAMASDSINAIRNLNSEIQRLRAACEKYQDESVLLSLMVLSEGIKNHQYQIDGRREKVP
jgi:hypothetical protein